jgi:hypothetical protein
MIRIGTSTVAPGTVEIAPILMALSVGASVVNVAVTDFAASIVTVQVELEPEQAPLHPPNVDPVVAVAVSVTAVPTAKSSVQSVPQVIPAGELVTVPEPVPALATLSLTGGAANVTVTDLDSSIAITQLVGVAEVHGPVQVTAEDATKVTTVSGRNPYDCEQPMAVQCTSPDGRPAGVTVTVPIEPVGAKLTVRTLRRVNVAVTDFAAFIVTVHVLPEPEHAPAHPLKVAPGD